MRTNGRRLTMYRRELENQRWLLTREYWRDREGSLDHAQGDPEDYIDLAVRTYTRDFLLSLSEMERDRLFQIEEALARIGRGDYGRCDGCGGRIPLERLDAVPWTPFCVACQGTREREAAMVQPPDQVEVLSAA